MTNKTSNFPLIQWVDRLMFDLAVMAGPWIAPLANGIIFAWALIDGFKIQMGVMAYVAGGAAGTGVVVAGATSSHVVMRSLEHEGKAPLRLWLLVFGYIALEIVGLILMVLTESILAVGIVVAFMTFIVYLSRSALISINERLENKRQEDEVESAELADQKAYERAQQEKEAEREQAIKMKEMELKHEQSLARIRAKAAAQSQAIQNQERTKGERSQISDPSANEQTEQNRTSNEHPQYTEQIRIIREQANGNPVNVQDVQKWTGVGRTTAYEILKLPEFERVQRGRYELNGKS